MQQLARRDKRQLLDAERAADDLEDETGQSLPAQLEQFGETVAVSLNAPFLPAGTVDQLIKMQIHAELAYLAGKLMNFAK